jgi:hypothetical protein
MVFAGFKKKNFLIAVACRYRRQRLKILCAIADGA